MSNFFAPKITKSLMWRVIRISRQMSTRSSALGLREPICFNFCNSCLLHTPAVSFRPQRLLVIWSYVVSRSLSICTRLAILTYIRRSKRPLGNAFSKITCTTIYLVCSTKRISNLATVESGIGKDTSSWISYCSLRSKSRYTSYFYKTVLLTFNVWT